MLVFFAKFLLGLSAVVMIILVLLQKGKGGGLAGALGGMGGQSAFGTKAGDLFTKITIGVAFFWIVISVLTAIYAPELGGPQIGVTQANTAPPNPGLETPPAGKPADSAAGKADKGGKSQLPGSTDKGSKGNKPAEKLPEKAAGPITSPAAPQK